MTRVEFAVPLTPDECVARLAAVTNSNSFFGLFQMRPLDGWVSWPRVLLCRRTFSNNPFKTHLRGRFETQDGVTVFRGRFGIGGPGFVFATVACGFAVFLGLWTLGAFVVSAARGAPTWNALCAGPLVFASVAVFVWLGRYESRGDDAFLVAVVKQTLGVPDAVAAVTPPGERPA